MYINRQSAMNLKSKHSDVQSVISNDVIELKET